MSLHDLGVIATTVIGIFFFGHILNKGKLSGYGYEVICTIALGLVFWAFLSREHYFGLINYAFH